MEPNVAQVSEVSFQRQTNIIIIFFLLFCFIIVFFFGEGKLFYCWQLVFRELSYQLSISLNSELLAFKFSLKPYQIDDIFCVIERTYI